MEKPDYFIYLLLFIHVHMFVLFFPMEGTCNFQHIPSYLIYPTENDKSCPRASLLNLATNIYHADLYHSGNLFLVIVKWFCMNFLVIFGNTK